ncbi:hypothetical protein, partial [Actinosynnema sp.]|uniref:hypothetical protein n=1 Tax=Actinosynnema sp. TaxID=1872144 RepID=UPI003F87A40E
MDASLLPWISGLTIAAALPLLVWSVAPGDSTRARALRNLERGSGLAVPGVGRTTADSSGALARIGRRLTPSGLLQVLDRSHSRAGRPAAWPLDRILATKVVLLAAGLVVSLLVATSMTPLGLRTLAAVVLVPPFAFFLPDILLYNTGIKRRDQIQRALPDMLDQLSIAVEAGLGFEGALQHVARHTT